MRIAAICALLLGACGASAQTVIDGSASNVDAQTIQLAIMKVANLTKDPLSVQFRNIRNSSIRSDVICGEYNAKNSFGGYVGFKPFITYTFKTIMVGDDFTEQFAYDISGCK